jgi:flagellar biosynthetic protein FlhB
VSGEKTEKPTPQRQKEARRDGSIARTPDLGAWGGMLAASVLLPMTVRGMMQAAERVFVRATGLFAHPEPGTALKLLTTAMREAAFAAAPLVFGMMLIGVAAAAAQGGLRPSGKIIKPDFKRLNPLSGIKRTFGGHALWEMVKVLAKTAVLAGVLDLSVRELLPVVLNAGAMPITALVSTVTDSVLSLIRSVALAGLVMAGGDYAMARRRINKKIKMSKHEVKEEHRRSEGDPQLKGAIRAKQLAMSRQRMMSDLVHADVVLVNPTHIAVALRYDPAKGAPRVVAKGAGTVAAKIREVAADKRIPMVQDIPLARALHASCELGQVIPPQLYGAVARVLAFIMTLKARGSAAGLHRNVLAPAA